jgi:hypothetical protein
MSRLSRPSNGEQDPGRYMKEGQQCFQGHAKGSDLVVSDCHVYCLLRQSCTIQQSCPCRMYTKPILSAFSTKTSSVLAALLYSQATSFVSFP